MGRCDAKDRSGVPDHRQCLQGSHDGADWLGRFPIGRGDAKKQHRGSGDDMARDHRVVKGEPREQGQWRLPAKRLLDDGSRQLLLLSQSIECRRVPMDRWVPERDDEQASKLRRR